MQSSFFAISLILNVKKVMTKKAVWLGIALLFFVFAAGGVLVRTETPVIIVDVGVFYDAESLLGSRIFEFLNESVADTPFVRFILYDDLDALITDVKLGHLECGYVFEKGARRVARGELSGIATVITSPRTVATPILNDIVAAAILRAAAEDITLDGLEAVFGASEELSEFVAWQFHAYEQMDIFMVPDFAGEYGQTEERVPGVLETIIVRVFHGLIGLTVLILAMFCIPLFIEERRSGLGQALAAHKKLWVYDISIWGAMFFALLSVGMAGFLFMAIFLPQILGDLASGTMALVMYTAVCATILTLAVRFLKDSSLIQSFGLFIVILNIFFGGVILDLAEINEVIARLQLVFPLFWYIEMAIS